MNKTLATGADLTAETFSDFVTRLRHHCRGEGVRDHCTAAAIFTVEARRFVYGISEDYTDKIAIICDDRVWHSLEEYIDDCDADEINSLNCLAVEQFDNPFTSLSDSDRLEIITQRDDHTVTGWDERWEHVGTHFTKEAAEAFIKRKGHDYPNGLRVYVEAQPYAWEFEAIKEAIMDGRLVFAEGCAA